MTIQDSSMLPLEVNLSRSTSPSSGSVRGHILVKCVWGLVISAAMSCCGLGEAAVAESLADVRDMRKNGPLFAALAEPPPTRTTIVDNEAQLGEPDAPFFFGNDVLHLTGSFESSRLFRIGEQAVIKTDPDVTVHVSGVINNQAGSPYGLTKLGAGTLVLSGENTYRGTTMLLQGGLHVGSNSALASTTLHANTGTTLKYAPGVTLVNPVQLQEADVERHVPPGSYSPVVPLEYADSVQLVVDSGEAIQGGWLLGDAPLVKQGAGRLRITADAMAYFGAATVNQGTLAIDEYFSGSVQVNTGARLHGFGQVGSTTIMKGGTLAAGNRVGKLTVQGDLVFKPEARLEVEVSPHEAATVVDASQRAGKPQTAAYTKTGVDLAAINDPKLVADPANLEHFVKVTGKAVLDGEVIALAQAGDWEVNSSYPLLRAEDGLDNTQFASVKSNFAFLTPSLRYSDKEVHLTLSRNDTSFEEVAENPTQEKVAEVLDDNRTLHDNIVLLSKPQAAQAFQQLSGSWAASIQSSLVDDSRFLRQAVLGVLGTSKVWGHAFYSANDRAAQNGAPADARTIGGVVLGLSRPVSRDWSVGGFVGAQHSHLWRAGSGPSANAVGGYDALAGLRVGEGPLADAKIQSTHVGLSLAGHWKTMKMVLGAAHTWHAISGHRLIDVGSLYGALRSSYRGSSNQLFGEVSFPDLIGRMAAALDGGALDDGASGDRVDKTHAPQNNFDKSVRTGRPFSWMVEPFVRLAWLHAGMQGFTEQGGAAALNVRPANNSVLFSTLGLKLTHAFETNTGAAEIQSRLGWRHASGSVHPVSRQSFRDSVNQTVFKSEGQPVPRSAWLFELGVKAGLAKNVSLGLAYAGQLASGVQDHGAKVNMAWVF